MRTTAVVPPTWPALWPVLFLAAGLVALPASAAVPAAVAKAVADPTRPKADTDTDASRDPADTLAFVGLKPGANVVELFPGGGYFTRMIVDLVGPTGSVHGIENAGWKGAGAADQKVMDELKARKDAPKLSLDIEPFGQMHLEPGKADVFWITQNYHDLKIAEYGTVDMAVFNKAVFAALKPGGTYFILDHEATPGLTLDGVAKLHRVEKKTVIAEVTAAGFKLVSEGGFLHRPGDDHTLSIFDKKIQGKTDQYALKFVKPK